MAALDEKCDYTTGSEDLSPPNNDSSTALFGNTRADKANIHRMGKTQELIRIFHSYSSFCFVCVLTASWEFLMIANTNILVDGGRAGFFWSFIWTVAGMTLIIASLAEMSSIAPTSGGQYHWVSEFASPKWQKSMSYVAGWLATLSWQASTASGGTLVGGIMQGLITMFDEGYEAPRWHLCLLAVANIVFVNVFNVYGSRVLGPAQYPLMVVHVGLLLAVVGIYWGLSPHANAADVFLNFENSGGWSSTGLALMIGQITSIFGLTSCDCAAHISEEVKDAARIVPRAMFWGFVTNSTLAFIFVICYLFAIPSVEDAINDSTGFPFLYVFNQALSPTGTAAITGVLLFLLVASNISFNASTARQTFAFARDKGLPFSGWIGHVDPKLHIPANSIWTTMIISILLNLIILGSTQAFNALLSLQLVALIATYFASISCMLWRRITYPETLPPAQWSLSKWGIPINSVACAYCIFAFFWCFWPETVEVTLEDMNWSSVMFVGIMACSGVLYFVRGRKMYDGPVTTVEGYDASRRMEGFR